VRRLAILLSLRIRPWVGAVLLLVIPVAAFGHATVSPGASRPGAYERYTLRVPNESDNPTVRIEMTFPAEVRVISFLDVPGWKLSATMDSTGRAVSAVWTGSLPPERFVELPFIGVNPQSATRIAWPVTQIYANGDRIEWSGPPESSRPASVTQIGDATPGAYTTSKKDRLPLWSSVAAVMLALVAVGVAARRR